MKHACACSTFHFHSLTLFAYEVICHLLICFKISLLLLLLFFLKKYFRNIGRVSNNLDPDHALRFAGPDLGQNCLQRLSADDTSK